MLHIKGKFCGPCAIRRIKNWRCQNTPSNEPSLICEDCGRWRNQQWENDRVLQSLELKDLLNEVARRMKNTS